MSLEDRVKKIERRIAEIEKQISEDKEVRMKTLDFLLKISKKHDTEISQTNERFDRILEEILSILETDEQNRAKIQQLREQGIFDHNVS